MRFNIKEWQDKHLIKESKLKEIDFKDQAAFKKYSTQHKMKPTTKITIGGKQTTAGQASGKEKQATKLTFDKDNLGDQVRANIDVLKRNPKKAAEQFTQDIIAAIKTGKMKWKNNHPSTNYRYIDRVNKFFRVSGIKVPKFTDKVFDKIKAAAGEGKR